MLSQDIRPVYINGRFLTQSLSGVQRFAREISSALQRVHMGEVSILVPPGALQEKRIVRQVGRRQGHIWEQLELPEHARDGILVNLGNTAPLRFHQQIVVVHDAGVFTTPEAYSWQFRMWYKFLQRRLAASSCIIATVSEFSRRELIRYLNVNPDRVAVIGEGADHMQRIAADPNVLIDAGLAPGRFVLAVGNLAVHKNLGSLGDLAHSLAERGMILAIVGGLASGPFRPHDRLRGIGSVRYLGRVSDEKLKALYQSAGCFVFPSLYEGFGLPAVEALMCRCLVVAADIPALREVCGDAALYFPPASPTDIALQVCRLLDDGETAHRLRRAAEARILRHTWDRAARALDEIIVKWESARDRRGMNAEEIA